ncbi:MAG: hypothetical protein QOI35_1678 [Cryptosporangiaceae bacterium]|jgi:uncharacterized protein YbjT (DUF2867 family)|nr:hypothetical protein [Cryptosporangiaceae bacterium]
MRVVVFGASGMVGRGVLHECLRDERVSDVLVVGRTPSGEQHPKLREFLQPDITGLSGIEDELAAADACFFGVGTSSVWRDADEYRALTYDLTLAVARTLARLNPAMTFVYVSGAGTDAEGRMRWARVKGETENALLALPFHAVIFRPGYIQPRNGARSKTAVLQLLYTVTSPAFPLFDRLLPSMMTTTERIGRAFLAVAEGGSAKPIYETPAINAAAR